MKFNISIILNIILLIALGMVVIGHAVSDHYYKDFTGIVLRTTAEQVKAGQSDLVVQVLSSVKGRPTYGDLISMLDKLKRKEPDQAMDGAPY